MHTTPQVSFVLAFNIASADPFIKLDTPQYCQRYAWSGAFAGYLTGSLLGLCICVGIPLVLGVNPKYYMLDM